MFLQLQDEFLPMLEENKNELILDMKGKIIANVDAEKLSRAFSNLLKMRFYIVFLKQQFVFQPILVTIIFILK